MTRAVLSGVLGAALFGVVQVAVASPQPKSIVVGPAPPAWNEATTVTQAGTFVCGGATAEYSFTIQAKVGITALSASVSGRPVAAAELERVKREINAHPGFDFVSFNCNDRSYVFQFNRYGAEGQADWSASIQGSLPGS
ncbi:hypothetical protein QO010_000158 [Caulobacter ginsengisoli]|uniref:Uncharacterized protein n=1 Tax=Caulobacter ginsengisoli TaxID=400775 RepID=A0ABU0IK72_9CAUL|nr:hypothetical protein [Caulobacter ginsengisoli]MDQ0462410.1 hypothetical protein [Caulobacter ginsengisoli]